MARKTKQQRQPEWLEYEVVNWEKYNPRTDRANYTWFRLQNTIASEPKFFGLTPSQKWVALCLLAEYSKNGAKPVKVLLLWFAHLVESAASEIIQTYQHLVTNGVFRTPETVTPQPSDTKLPATDVRTYVRDGRNVTNETNETNETTREGALSFSPGFLEAYGKYPKQGGKGKAARVYQAAVPTPEAHAKLLQAIHNYVTEKKKTDEYLASFSNFLAEWTDWIDPKASAETQDPRVEQIRREREEIARKLAVEEAKLNGNGALTHE